VGSMTTSRIVMPCGRVSMNVTTLATSLGSSKLPDSLASFSFSGGQSASNALMTAVNAGVKGNQYAGVKGSQW
jgi:hypothetical protein